MLEKTNILLLILLIILVGALSYQIFFNPQTQCANKQERYPFFLDSPGKLIDPYLQREVKNTITANAREVQICYNHFIERMGKDTLHKSGGTVHIDWMVDIKGMAQNARVVYSDFADEKLKSCIVTQLNNWSFPPPGESRYSEHRFSFSQQE